MSIDLDFQIKFLQSSYGARYLSGELSGYVALRQSMLEGAANDVPLLATMFRNGYGHVVIVGSRGNELSRCLEEVTKFHYIQLKSRTFTGSDQTHELS
jgi:hypothetical protein